MGIWEQLKHFTGGWMGLPNRISHIGITTISSDSVVSYIPIYREVSPVPEKHTFTGGTTNVDEALPRNR